MRIVFISILVATISILSHLSSHPLSVERSIDEKTKGMKKYSGFLTFYWDEREGKIWLEIDRWQSEVLYVSYLAHGIGSNDIGLDRGQIGNSMIVEFHRHGPKVFMVQPNYGYRASSDNPSEQHAVTESFAQSVVWGFHVAAEDGEKVIVDATGFFLRDAHAVISKLKALNQGIYQQDTNRSAIYLDQTRNFPLNTEVEAILTFSGESPGSYVRQVVPSPKSVTVHIHHSFVQLPEKKFESRGFDPRAGYFPLSYYDYSTPIDQPVGKSYIYRHRLQKKNPDAQVSEAVEPIVYYVDAGTPEPIRSALLEGASWWNEAFEAMGYKDAFQVKLLPLDADPLDIRYNVIQWIHRATRGWSYGSVVADPRSGEILKGHVSLGSLRVRQDFLIAQGLLGPYSGDTSQVNTARQMALARIRQLSAHEVGHTLGLAHNFAASTFNRASVMDYPHPLVNMNEDNTINLSNAYDEGIGAWDKIAIAYGYQDFPGSVDEQKALDQIIDNYIDDKFIFVSDHDARPAGGAHPLAHLWDNGSDPIAELDRVLEIRRNIMTNFSDNRISMGSPMYSLEKVLVPMYLFHRFQTEAAAKLLAGNFYTYALRGDGQPVTSVVDPHQQRKALAALLRTIQPSLLAVPENILALIPPPPVGFQKTREQVAGRTGVTFDPLSAAENAARITIELLLNPERAARLVEYHSRNRKNPGLIEVLNQLLDNTWKKPQSEDAYLAQIRRVVDNLVLRQMMLLAVSENSALQVKAISLLKLNELEIWLSNMKPEDEQQQAHFLSAGRKIKRFLENPDSIKIFQPLDIPAGPPIGSGYGWHVGDFCSWSME